MSSKWVSITMLSVGIIIFCDECSFPQQVALIIQSRIQFNNHSSESGTLSTSNLTISELIN